MSTPMAITASKVPEEPEEDCSLALFKSPMRSGEDPPNKSVAVLVVFVCTCEALIILEHAKGSSKLPGTLCKTIFFSETPRALSWVRTPSTSELMMASFHLA